MFEEEVRSSRCRLHDNGRRQRFVLGLKGCETDVAVLAFLHVHVEREEACFLARRDADQRIWIPPPPLAHDLFVRASAV